MEGTKLMRYFQVQLVSYIQACVKCFRPIRLHSFKLAVSQEQINELAKFFAY